MNATRQALFVTLLFASLVLALFASCANMTTRERNQARTRIEAQREAGTITEGEAAAQLEQLELEDGNGLLWAAIAANFLVTGLSALSRKSSLPRSPSPAEVLR